MKALYELAIEVMADIKQIENAIGSLSGNGIESHYRLRTNGEVRGSYVYAKVRTSNYVKLLHAEKKDLEKDFCIIKNENLTDEYKGNEYFMNYKYKINIIFQIPD